MRKKVVLINWEDTIVNYEDILFLKAKKLFNEKLESTVYRLPLNQSIVDFIKHQSSIAGVSVLVTSRYNSLNVVKKSLDRAGISEHAVDFARIIDEEQTQGRINNQSLVKVAKRYLVSESCLFVCVCNQDTYKIICEALSEIKNSFEHNGKQKKSVLTYNIVPCLYQNAWNYFSSTTFIDKSKLDNNTCFADHVSAIGNYIACLWQRPEDAKFKHSISDDVSKKTYNKKFLFDYYATSDRSPISEPFSLMLRNELKDGKKDKAPLTDFFFKVLKRYLDEELKIKNYAIVVVPSSTQGKWNEVLSSEAKRFFSTDESAIIDIIKRTETIEKQHFTGKRDIGIQINSLRVMCTIPHSIKTIVLVDDIVTTGTSFEACTKVLENTGFSGSIMSFAVAGTRNSTDYVTSVQEHNMSSRPSADTGYIFELDNTLVDSDNAFRYREQGQWKQAIDCISKMRPYTLVIETLRRLVVQGTDVAIVTSAPLRYTYAVLRQIGVDPESVCVFSDYNTVEHKSNPQPFLIAEQLMAHDNKKIIYVGNSIGEDVTCFNASKQDKQREYNPVFAGWNKRITYSDLYSALHEYKYCASEFEFAKQAEVAFMHSDDLFHFYNSMIQVWAANMPMTFQQFKSKLIEMGLLNNEEKPTEKGVQLGIFYDTNYRFRNGGIGSAKVCTVDAQIFIADFLLQDEDPQTEDNTDNDYLSEEDYASVEGFWIDDDGNWIPKGYYNE